MEIPLQLGHSNSKIVLLLTSLNDPQKRKRRKTIPPPPNFPVAMVTLLHISTLDLYPAAPHMKGPAVAYYYVSVFVSRNFPITVHLSGGQCGSWYKECLWPLKAWPHWPEAVYVVPTGNDSLQIQIRSTVVLATPSNTFKPSCRLLSGSLHILKDLVLYGRIFQWQRAGFTPFTRFQ